MRLLHCLVSFAILATVLLSNVVHGQEEQSCTVEGSCEDPPCDDYAEDCHLLAGSGECNESPEFMLRKCAKSCNACGPCTDEHDECPEWAEDDECENNPRFMLIHCRKSCDNCPKLTNDENFGVEQNLDDVEHHDAIAKVLEDMKEYFKALRDDPKTTTKMHAMLDNCKNKDELCALWKVLGECEANPPYMKLSCAPVCQTCEMLDIEVRCPLDPNAPNAWGPGDLNAFFVNITTLPDMQRYEPKVISRPAFVDGDDEEKADYKIGPWVVTLDKFVTDEEADRLIELGAAQGYQRSSDVGELKFDGSFEDDVNEGRTSNNAWCQDECYTDPLSQQVMARIEEITNIGRNNSEDLQLLKYEVGEYYRTHHDYIDFEVNRQGGVRLLTVFLYLNDVEGGGGTNFPLLDITVMPKKGRALIWPSVLDEDPNLKDPRTDHQALEVEKGTKYGANAWIHMRNIKAAEEMGC
jgi:prolyl 4-hydroxylase